MIELRNFVIVAGVAFAMFASPRPVSAHGSVTPDEDICIIQIGYYRAHVKIYLPEERGHQEYCEDIPQGHIGQALAVEQGHIGQALAVEQGHIGQALAVENSIKTLRPCAQSVGGEVHLCF